MSRLLQLLQKSWDLRPRQATLDLIPQVTARWPNSTGRPPPPHCSPLLGPAILPSSLSSLLSYLARGCQSAVSQYKAHSPPGRPWSLTKRDLGGGISLKKKKITYLAVSGLSCGAWGLASHGTQTPQLECVGPVVAAHELSCPVACGILVPRSGNRSLVPCIAR